MRVITGSSALAGNPSLDQSNRLSLDASHAEGSIGLLGGCRTAPVNAGMRSTPRLATKNTNDVGREKTTLERVSKLTKETIAYGWKLTTMR